MISLHAGCLLLVVGTAQALSPTEPPPPPPPSVSDYNVVFDVPSDNGPAQNTPVGNGELVANVWVDGVRGGSLALLLGRSDVFSDYVQPLKLGRFRVEFEPNPFAVAPSPPSPSPPSPTPPPGPTPPCYAVHPGYIGDQHAFAGNPLQCSSVASCASEASKACNEMRLCQSFATDPDWGDRAEFYSDGLDKAGANPAWTLWTKVAGCTPPVLEQLGSAFIQELDLSTGAVNITSTASGVSVQVRVWSDANAVGTADSIHIEVKSTVPTRVSVILDNWRLTPTMQSTKSTARGPCEAEVLLQPDSVAVGANGTRPAGSLTWYRRNNESSFNKTMSDQMLGKLAARMQDPLLGRASGALIVGSSSSSSSSTAPFTIMNGTFMRSAAPSTQHTISVFTHTAIGTKSANDFLKQLDERAASSITPAAAWPNHTAWWQQFWDRSWAVFSSTSTAEASKAEDHAAAVALTEAYWLNRYLVAIQSRGVLPMHHNGGTVTWGWDGTSHANPDERPWGGGYWFQNVRHSYWYALNAGDYDLLTPLFSMYLEQMPVLEERSRQWWKHNGSQFEETTYFFGTYEPVDYGCGRSNKPDAVNPYIKHHYEGGVELAVMMLQAYAHTGDIPGLLNKFVLPWCESLLTFYDEHYPKYPNGTLFLQHAQSCETWPDCDNPAPQVAALHRIADGLMAVPKNLLSAHQAALFGRIAKSLPRIPITPVKSGGMQVSPCEGGFPSHHVNSENVETYAVWPYEYFAVNRSESVEAEFPAAVGINTFNNVRFGHGNSAWRYDGQDAALLGMASYAWSFAASRVLSQGHCEGSNFPGYLASDPGDGAPQVESNGIVAVTLQKMLVQTDAGRILLFPAWLGNVDVDAKLHIPSHAATNRPAAVLRVVTKAGKVTHLDVSPLSRAADVVVLQPQM